jgi:hypothetical protein
MNNFLMLIHLFGIIRQVFEMEKEIVKNLDAKIVESVFIMLLNLMKVDGSWSFV